MTVTAESRAAGEPPELETFDLQPSPPFAGIERMEMTLVRSKLSDASLNVMEVVTLSDGSFYHISTATSVSFLKRSRFVQIAKASGWSLGPIKLTKLEFRQTVTALERDLGGSSTSLRHFRRKPGGGLELIALRSGTRAGIGLLDSPSGFAVVAVSAAPPVPELSDHLVFEGVRLQMRGKKVVGYSYEACSDGLVAAASRSASAGTFAAGSAPETAAPSLKIHVYRTLQSGHPWMLLLSQAVVDESGREVPIYQSLTSNFANFSYVRKEIVKKSSSWYGKQEVKRIFIQDMMAEIGEATQEVHFDFDLVA